ncbi:argininosuccinate lyase [Marinovum sp.]|uniref:argininosuccinate lyase n=1 Tax=Marinovum sp. TaxID=2024839 RepID=UPI002B279E51|nr:argininosuccinate lyase [Marinovum sp.]
MGKRFGIRELSVLAVLAVLAGCGVDGAPERPEAEAPLQVEISGTAEVGIAGGSN